MGTSDNQQNRQIVNAGGIPQNARNHTAIVSRKLDWIQSDIDTEEPAEEPEYTPYQLVQAIEKKPAKAAITVLYYTGAAAGIAGGSYAVLMGLAWLVVQVKFWAIMGIWLFVAMAFNNMRHGHGHTRRAPDTDRQGTPDNRQGHTFIVHHSGNGDINIRTK
ncbi:MAG: hypothetical protein KF852_04305 [Saprospiraceae bacterium]|nr:hypothetical protein [Saprospiraceae bacterium]